MRSPRSRSPCFGSGGRGIEASSIIDRRFSTGAISAIRGRMRWVGWALATLVALGAVRADAQPKGKAGGGKAKAPAAAPAVDTKPIIEKVKSGDAAKIAEGLAAAQAAGANA